MSRNDDTGREASRMPSRRTVWFLAGAIAVIVAGVALFQGREPPAKVTMRVVAEAADAVTRYTERFGHPPESIEALVSAGLLAGPVLDGWGKPLVLRSDPANREWVEVVSLGADQAAGGMLFERDHVVRVALPPAARRAPPAVPSSAGGTRAGDGSLGE